MANIGPLGPRQSNPPANYNVPSSGWWRVASSLAPPPVTEHTVNILAGGGTVGGEFERLFPTQRIVFSVAQEFVVPFVP